MSKTEISRDDQGCWTFTRDGEVIGHYKDAEKMAEHFAFSLDELYQWASQPALSAVKQVLQQITQAARVGQLEFAGRPPTLDGKPDFTLTEVKLEGVWTNPHHRGGPVEGITVCWQTVSAGFGMVVIMKQQDGSVLIDSEMMDRDFIKCVLCKLVDEAKLVNEPAGQGQP